MATHRLFSSRLPFCFHRFPVRVVRVRKSPPMSLVWHVFDRVAEDLGEFEVDNLILASRSSGHYHAHRRLKYLLPAAQLASFQCILNLLTLRDVHCKTHHPSGLAVLRVLELPPGNDTTRVPILPNDAKLLRVGCSALSRNCHCIRDSLTVFGMDVTVEVPNLPTVRIG